MGEVACNGGHRWPLFADDDHESPGTFAALFLKSDSLHESDKLREAVVLRTDAKRVLHAPSEAWPVRTRTDVEALRSQEPLGTILLEADLPTLLLLIEAAANGGLAVELGRRGQTSEQHGRTLFQRQRLLQVPGQQQLLASSALEDDEPTALLGIPALARGPLAVERKVALEASNSNHHALLQGSLLRRLRLQVVHLQEFLFPSFELHLPPLLRTVPGDAFCPLAVELRKGL
mmetsp:Transcript_56065/g.121233  ORF Transcript_56065/g.121233 Transcript_56065/m.121233 type:complete len:232 (+) Transcript_56065:603-1298(+)